MALVCLGNVHMPRRAGGGSTYTWGGGQAARLPRLQRSHIEHQELTKTVGKGIWVGRRSTDDIFPVEIIFVGVLGGAAAVLCVFVIVWFSGGPWAEPPPYTHTFALFHHTLMSN